MFQNRFFKRLKLTQEILGKIAKIDEFKGLWKGTLLLSPQILGRLKASVIITSSGASTRIEGARMNDEEIARLLRGLKSKAPKGRDAQEVAGYADLLGRIFDNYKTMSLTEGQILQLHNIMLQFSVKDKQHCGQYKSRDNIVVAKNGAGQTVILFRPTPPYLVKKEMDDILFWVREESAKKVIHPLLVTLNFIFEFLAIHPFIDGNGRLSRALTNLLLLQTGYGYIPYVSLEEIVEERQVDYYLALRTTQKKHRTKDEDITPWLDFSLDVLLKQTEKAREIMQKAEPEKLLSEKQLAIYHLFNGGSILNVSKIYERMRGRIPQATIKQALTRLRELKLLERLGQGRATRYRRL